MVCAVVCKVLSDKAVSLLAEALFHCIARAVGSACVRHRPAISLREDCLELICVSAVFQVYLNCQGTVCRINAFKRLFGEIDVSAVV